MEVSPYWSGKFALSGDSPFSISMNRKFHSIYKATRESTECTNLWLSVSTKSLQKSTDDFRFTNKKECIYRYYPAKTYGVET
jgi:hypothetical protein